MVQFVWTNTTQFLQNLRFCYKGSHSHLQYVDTGLDYYLVVDNDMNGAMSGIWGKLTEVEGFIHNSLTSKCSITMQENGHHLRKKNKKLASHETGIPFNQSIF